MLLLRAARWSIVLLAAWGAWLTLALATGTWPAGLWPLRAPHAVPGRAAIVARDRAAAPGARATAPAMVKAPSAIPGAAASPSAIVATRYSVCPREESPPALSRVRLSDDGRELWALHCGSSVHLLAIEDVAGTLLARRLFAARVRSHSAAEAPRAVRVSASDVDGDGRADLLVPVLFTDRAGAPSSGSLAWLRQRAQGGFEVPARAFDVAVGDVAPAALDAEKGQDLALLQLGDARASRASELWLVRGGPALLRQARFAVGVGPSAVAAADLDRDGVDDVAVVSEREGKLRLWLSRRAEPQNEPVVLELEGVREAFAGDVDGDGARDLVLTGQRIWLLLARDEFRPEPLPVAGSEGLRDVQLEDANADGKLDLIGYAHPTLVALEQTAGLGFARRALATLRGDLGVLFARAAYLDDDGRPDLVLAVVGNAPDSLLEIAVAANLHDDLAVQLADRVTPVRDLPLVGHLALP